MNQYRCRFDYFNNKSKPMCSNWDCFFNSCKLTWYETTLEGKKQTTHPHLSSEKLWIIEQVGCASHSDFQSERETATGGWKRYRCNSDTCSDSGGVCILCIPDMDFAPPTSCVNPEAFTDNGDEPDCKWEELRQQAGE
jgi:hypothetical protein